MTGNSNLPVLLIPGLACTAALFSEQVKALKSNRQVLIADHMRHDSMQEIAASILADAPPRFALAGLSMGGYISFEIMRQAPQRVERLALLDTSARADAPEKIVLRQEALELAEAGKYLTVCHSTLGLSIARSRHQDSVLKQAIIDMAMDTGVDAWVRQTSAIMGRPDSVGMLGQINCPTLVIVGDEDQLTPPELAIEMAEGVAGAHLEVIADCGHMSSMERPDIVTDLLKGWLA